METKLKWLHVGNHKSGSLSIYNTVKKQLKLNCAPIKELGFLSNLNKSYKNCPITGDFHSKQILKLDEYYKNFSNGDFFESDPSYFFHSSDVLNNLKKFKMNPKILIVLRNPVHTIFSHYNHLNFNYPEAFYGNDFHTEIDRYNLSDSKYSWALKLRRQGLYYENLKNFLDSPLNITVLIFEEVFCNEMIYSQELNDFFGLNIDIKLPHDHKSKILHTLDSNLYKKLLNYYSKDIEKTSDLLKINLDKYWN